jgi:hypothetical protein
LSRRETAITTIAHPEPSRVTVGVDTHGDLHVACALDQLGRHLAQGPGPGQQRPIARRGGRNPGGGQVAAQLIQGAGDMKVAVGVDADGDPARLGVCDGSDGRLPSGQGPMAAPAERADNTATRLWRQAPVRSRSLGWCSPGRLTAAQVDSSRQRHQASENSGQTRAAVTAEIIAVKTSTAVP